MLFSPTPPAASVLCAEVIPSTGGDTLWAVASRHTAPGDDVRVVIARIKGASGIATSSIHPGQVLLIPDA